MVDLYVKPSITGYNSSPPSDDDSATSANAVSWAKHINKIGDPIKTLLDSVNGLVDTLADTLFGNAVTAVSSSRSLTTSDYGKTIRSSNAITITMLTGSSAGGNYVCQFYNSDASNDLTLGRNGVNINGAASNLIIKPKQSAIAFSDGTDWWISVFTNPNSASLISGDWTFSGTMGLTKGADVESANDTVLLSNGNYNDVTGTTTTNGMTTPSTGNPIRIIHYDDAVLLKHNTAPSGGFSKLFLPGAVDYTTAANDVIIYIYDGTYWRATSVPVQVSDVAYDEGTWDGNNNAATKNAIRDQLEKMGSDVTRIVKALDTDRDTTTTLAADPELTTTIAADGIYIFEAVLTVLSGSSTPDFKWNWVEPDGDYVFSSLSCNINSASETVIGHTSGAAAPSSGLTGNIPRFFIAKGLIRAGGTGGTFELQWAQNISNGVAVTVQAGSYMKLTKIA